MARAMSRGYGVDVMADNGCSAELPSCLNCPLVRCRFDEPETPREIQHRQRAAAMARRVDDLRARYGTLQVIDLVAGEYGVSKRTVHRALAATR